MTPYSVYLDANVFIEMWENPLNEHGRALWDLLARGGKRGWLFVSSELTLAEVLVKPIAMAKVTGDWTLADTYRFQIYDKAGFQRISPVSRAVLDRAANVRSDNVSLALPDAIHLATALIEQCDVFISNDSRFVTAIKNDARLFPNPFKAVMTFAAISELAALE